jgi:hypothetical protein
MSLSSLVVASGEGDVFSCFSSVCQFVNTTAIVNEVSRRMDCALHHLCREDRLVDPQDIRLFLHRRIPNASVRSDTFPVPRRAAIRNLSDSRDSERFSFATNLANRYLSRQYRHATTALFDGSEVGHCWFMKVRTCAMVACLRYLDLTWEFFKERHEAGPREKDSCVAVATILVCPSLNLHMVCVVVDTCLCCVLPDPTWTSSVFLTVLGSM